MSEPLTPTAYIEKAQRALKGTQALIDDADWEGACARAYYAMYNAAHAALETFADKKAKSQTHKGLIMLFGQLLVQTGYFDAELGRSLSRVQQIRLAADYTGDEIDEGDATSALAEAKAFVTAIHTKISAKDA